MDQKGENGTIHIQGYLEFDRPKRLAAVKTIKGLLQAHFIVCRGSRDSNRAYCSKEDTRYHDDGPHEFGYDNIFGTHIICTSCCFNKKMKQY